MKDSQSQEINEYETLSELLILAMLESNERVMGQNKKYSEKIKIISMINSRVHLMASCALRFGITEDDLSLMIKMAYNMLKKECE